MRQLSRFKLGIFMTVGALLVLAGPLIKAVAESNPPKHATSQQAATPYVAPQEKMSGQPVHIAIPAVHIDLPVAIGVFNEASGTWTISNGSAYFANVSALANNQAGSTFIYGHNTSQVFGRLPKLAVGDMATVTTANGHTFTYKLRLWYDVQPTDTTPLNYHGRPILTLQTCTGEWSQHRRMFVFDLVSAH